MLLRPAPNVLDAFPTPGHMSCQFGEHVLAHLRQGRFTRVAKDFAARIAGHRLAEVV